MKLETFFEKFDQFADAPDAVAKMREVILSMAVSGHLVPQDLNDEPAKELVERVAANLPDKKSENPFLREIEASITAESKHELPSIWAWLPLGHVGIWATGCGFPKQHQGETGREFLFCKVSDMNLPGNEVEIHATVHSIDAGVMKKIRARSNPVGTVIFPKIGGAIATHKRRLVIKPTIIDNNCSGIQPIGLTDDRWLLMFMRSLDLTKYQSGTSVPAVSQGSLDPIRIGLPPLAEQRRIVAKVDQLMALCDRLEAQQQERGTRHAALARASLARFADAPTPANLQFLFHKSYAILPADLRKSILTLAVQGQLVAKQYGDSSARDDFPIWTKAEVGSECGELPEHWIKVALGEVGDWVGGGTPSKSKPEYWNGTIPWVCPKDMKRPLITTSIDMITKEAVEGSSARIIPAGSLLMVVRGMILVRAFPVAIAGCEVTVNQDMKSVYSAYPETGEYLHLALRALEADFLNAVERSSHGTCKLSTKDLHAMPIPVPPLAEQRRIVAKVDQLMALVDELENQLAASRDTAKDLLEALVAELTTAGAASPEVPA